jgi:leucyl aminopeptidase
LLKHLTVERDSEAIPLIPIRKKDWESWLEGQGAGVKSWVTSTRFAAEAGRVSLVPGDDGTLQWVLVGLGDDVSMWDWAGFPAQLPERTFYLDAQLSQDEARGAALGWALGTYRFENYREVEGTLATLVWPEGVNRDRVEQAALATFMVRDLINTPASDMGPEELAAAAEKLAKEHGASTRIVVGDDLIKQKYPSIHAVGRASTREPRLIDLRWGDEAAKKVTLVGKGVCFDSGGLDLKPAANMKLMKKDMGGAAQVLGVAKMVMAANLPVRLRVLIPAVENAVSGNALRPLDIVETRKGLNVEIGNTDAEGRVILSDALADAADEEPELIVDFATLTGAARVSLGTDLPAMFSNDDAVADDLLQKGKRETDPLWRMPLWKPYRKMMDSKVANLNNAAASPYAGAITAALFLSEFVGKVPWAHIDLMGWNVDSKPGRPEGGEAQGMRAVFALLESRYGN